LRILLIDIETTPHLAWTFDLRNVTIPQDHIVQPSRILCFSAMWYGEEEVEFWDMRDEDSMYLRLWQLLDEADAVVHFYGKRFDVPMVKGELWQRDFYPPAPFGQIDLWETARKQFKLASNRLAYISQLVGSSKAKHEGFSLWLRCMEGDEDAWAQMEEYNKQDVRAMVPVYESFLPWITNHPSYGAHTGKSVCPNCGGHEFVRQGFRTTRTGRYRRFQCRGCGTWSSGTKREGHTEIVSAA